MNYYDFIQGRNQDFAKGGGGGGEKREKILFWWRNLSDVIWQRYQNDVIIDIFEVLLCRN